MPDSKQARELERLRSEVAVLKQLLEVHEAAALSQTRKLENILNSITDGFLVFSHSWRVIYANQQAEKIFEGLKKDPRSIVGKNLWEQFPELKDSIIYDNYNRVMTERVPVTFEAFYAGRWFELHAYPSEDGISVLLQEISARKKEESVMRRTEKLAATGELANTMAHEINNPLQAVTNLIALLSYKTSSFPETNALSKLAEQELARVTRITRHLLAFYSESPVPVPVRITDLLEDVLEVILIRRQGARGLTIERRFEFEGRVSVLPGELRHLFTNLISNAVEAIGERGKVTIHVYSSAELAGDQRRGIRVVIFDSGPGIPQAHRASVFEPFFTSKGEKGTGLGLWVAQNLANKYGGSIRLWSSSVPGRATGTAVSVFLPLEPVAEASPVLQSLKKGLG